MTIPPLRAVLRNRRLLRTIVAALAFDVAEWALWVGVIVYAFERGGATTAGFAALGLLVPSALAAPIAGVLADGPRPERVLVLGYCAESIALAAATVAVYAEAPLASSSRSPLPRSTQSRSHARRRRSSSPGSCRHRRSSRQRT